MKRTLNYTLISFFALMIAITGCKFEKTEDPGVLRIDISALKKNLTTPSQASASYSEKAAQSVDSSVASPDSPAQTPVQTLLIAPLSFTNHGKPYDPDEPFTDAVENDLEKDAANSVNLVQLITLPTDKDYVEVEVPTVSEGWQLLAAASTKLLESPDDIATDDNIDSLVYVGFTKESFTTAEDFNNSSNELQMRRNCYNVPTPRGCAVFDGRTPIVTPSVEIHKITINGVEEWPKAATYLKVRSNTDANSAIGMMSTTLNNYETANGVGSINEVVVFTTHQESNANEGTACADATSDYSVCAVQEYKYIF